MQCLKVINDPISYISSERIQINPFFLKSNKNRSVFNGFITEIYELQIDDIEFSAYTAFWFLNWDYLYKIVFIIGCLAHKEKLLWRGQISKMPDWARNSLKFLPFKLDSNLNITEFKQVTIKNIICEGILQLKKYIQNMPLELSKRFFLIFPPYADNLKKVAKHTVSSEILNMVSHYVKKNKHSC